MLIRVTRVDEISFCIMNVAGVKSNIAYNVEALAMWRYSVLRLLGAAAD